MRSSLALWSALLITAAAGVPLAASAAPGPPGVASPRLSSGFHPNRAGGSSLLISAASPETLEFAPSESDSAEGFLDSIPWREEEDEWIRAPFGEGLLTEREQWRPRRGFRRVQLLLDYNRVDRLRLGLGTELHAADRMAPRLGARIEYAFGRERLLYGAQLEQPIVPPGRIALGVSAVRRTDHNELQQIGDAENTLAMLLGRYDYRDYFEREGMGGYLAWWVPDFSTVSINMRRDEYRSLPLDPGTPSWFHRSRVLRDNPPVDEGESHTGSLRLERALRAGRHAHAGLYHWIELEWADHGLGGDFEYVRALGDLRSVLRLSPATTLMLRLAAGHAASGYLPVQKQFAIGGIDGLRAHSFDEFRGNQMMLSQAEYSLGLWRPRRRSIQSGIDALAFVDAGQAWSHPRQRWDLGRQHIDVDGGLGLATAEDNLRIYVARDLQQRHADVRISVRLHRPF